MRFVSQARSFWQQGNIAFALCGLATFAVAVYNITVFDDAYITFRVIDNFLNGYGLRYNLDERVQVYTHPLWMMLHIPVIALLGNIYISNVLISLACALLTMAAILTMVPASPWHKAVLVLLPFSLSPAFNSYVMCGLENPLTFCLYAAFIHEWVRPQGARYYRLCLFAALAALTRLDNIMLLLPMLGGATWEERRKLCPATLLAAWSPLIGWLAFSLYYYGFFLPNTAYAKAMNGIPALDMIQQGFKYLYNLSYYDTLFFCAIISALVIAARCVLRVRIGVAEPLEHRITWLGAGLLLNIAYVIYVGGDYMCGRFWAASGVVAVILNLLFFYRCQLKTLAYFAASIGSIALLHHYVIVPNAPDMKNYRVDFGINDHHTLYYYMNGLFSDRQHLLRTAPTIPPNPEIKGTVWVTEFIGYQGFIAGSGIHIIDYFALSDPLIARLPVRDLHHWRVGHFPRNIPRGYAKLRETGDASEMDASLLQYYQKLQLVTQGELFDPERWQAILGFQLGAYDHWRDEYLERVQQKPAR